MFQLFSISCVITSILSFSLGIFVWLKNRQSLLNLYWSLVGISSGLWSLSLWGVINAKTQFSAINWQYLLDISAIFTSVFFLLFVLIVIGEYKKKKYIRFVSLFLALILSILSFTTLFKIGVAPKMDFNYWVVPGSLYFLFPLFLSLNVFYFIFLLIVAYFKNSGYKKNQLKYILLAAIIGFSGGTTNFLPQFFDIYPFGNLFVSFYVIVITYTITRYRLMDIKFILRRSSVYLSSVVTISLFAVGIKYFIIKYFFEFYQWTDILILVAAVSIFVPIKNCYYKLANKYFFTSLYNSNEVISSIGSRLQATLNIYKIYDYIYEELDKSFHVDAFGFLKYDEEIDGYIVKYNKNFSINLNQKFKNNKLLDIKYNSKNKILVLDEIRNSNNYNKKTKKLIDKLIKLKIDIIIPLKIKGKDIGVMVLGPKESKDIYNDEDLQILKIISSQVAIAIENASLYKRIENFNKYLKEKVDEQTKDIKLKSEYLQKLLTMRSEFLNIASHQLRTPVSVIKGVLSMLSENKISEEKKQELLNMAFQKSIKLNEIINSILGASEMESESFKIKFKTTNLEPVLKEIYNNKISAVKNRDIKIILNLPKKQLPNIKSNDIYLKHVFNNLINNSLQYTKKGIIMIDVVVKKNKIIIKIIDTGIGISKEEIPKLFHKFVRAKNAVESYTDGTGLGLFIVKKIINAHKGAKVYIEKTEIGKGTTMTVEFLISV